MPAPAFRTSVAVKHLPEQSDAAQSRWAFAYTVTVQNTGDVTAQLVARHWIVTDANGTVEEVRGLAVVATPHGTMRGHYLCVTEDARPFEAPVAEFGLTLASALH